MKWMMLRTDIPGGKLGVWEFQPKSKCHAEIPNICENSEILCLKTSPFYGGGGNV